VRAEASADSGQMRIAVLGAQIDGCVGIRKVAELGGMWSRLSSRGNRMQLSCRVFQTLFSLPYNLENNNFNTTSHVRLEILLGGT